MAPCRARRIGRDGRWRAGIMPRAGSRHCGRGFGEWGKPDRRGQRSEGARSEGAKALAGEDRRCCQESRRAGKPVPCFAGREAKPKVRRWQRPPRSSERVIRPGLPRKAPEGAVIHERLRPFREQPGRAGAGRKMRRAVRNAAGARRLAREGGTGPGLSARARPTRRRRPGAGRGGGAPGRSATLRRGRGATAHPRPRRRCPSAGRNSADSR